MDPGGGFDGAGGAFGAGKAGGAQDPLVFVKRPPVILRICTLLFAIIVFGCVSSQGWKYDQSLNKEICILNNSSSACHFPTGVGIVAFLASIGFLVGEWFFEQMSSVKTRKHYVLADLGFSAVWSFFYFIAFCVLIYAWRNTSPGMNYASSNIIGSIFFSFLSVLGWAGCAFFAWQRYQQGMDSTFNQGFEDMDQGTGYSAANDMDESGGYSEPPFSGGGGSQPGTAYQEPQY